VGTGFLDEGGSGEGLGGEEQQGGEETTIEDTPKSRGGGRGGRRKRIWRARRAGRGKIQKLRVGMINIQGGGGCSS
jgi:hypothetical protein